MTVVVWIFALVTAMVHILAFVWETCLFHRPGVHGDIFGIPTSDVPAVRLWAFNVGFYNLFVAGGLIGAVVIWISGNMAVGRALVIYLCAFAFLAGLALLVSDRLALSRPRGKGVSGSLAQSIPPLVVLVIALV